jgi:hypothetical protein
VGRRRCHGAETDELVERVRADDELANVHRPVVYILSPWLADTPARVLAGCGRPLPQ